MSVSESAGIEQTNVFSPKSRKRSNNQPDNDEPVSKRMGENDVQFKMMIPKSVVGAVIGKGGETMARLQEENGIKMIISKSHDTYPGTSERVVRLTGPIPGIVSVLRNILENGFVKIQDSDKGRDMYDNKHHDRNKQIKLIIPHMSAGIIIGKGGEGIKEVHELTGAYLDVSKRDREPNLAERVVTFAGETHDELVNCAEQLLERLSKDENANSIPMVNYADVHHMSVEEGKMKKGAPGGGPGQVGNGGDHVIMGAHAFDLTGGLTNGANAAQTAAGFGVRGSSVNNGSMCEAPISLVRGASNNNLLGFLMNLQVKLRNMQYPNDAILDIMGAMQTLASYNVLGLGLGFGLAAVDNYYENTVANGRSTELNSQVRRSGDQDMFQCLREEASKDEGKFGWSSQPAQDPRLSLGENGGYASAAKVVYDGGAYLKMAPNQTAEGGYSLRSSWAESKDTSSGSGAAEGGYQQESSVSGSVEVAESLIGVILGRGGSTLLDLQRVSGTTMSVSRKGEGAAVDDLRTVSILGTPQAVEAAKRLVERRVSEEKYQREQRAAMAASKAIA